MLFYNYNGDSMENKKYFTRLDILRILSCIAVFLYHLGYLKGGYLAVCTFFVLSGYLAIQSAYHKDNFSIKEYYKNRFKSIYLPYAIVILISVGVISLIHTINWLSLKPEVTSTLLGYNNFWQLEANLDYFARHADSPFMHFWYMGILLQFEIVFPFIYLLLKKIEKKVKLLPSIILELFAIMGAFYFGYQAMTNPNRMIVYYHTLTRLFSIIFGLFVGWVHCQKHSMYIKKIDSRIPFIIYSLILIGLFIFIDDQSSLFMIAMILTTLITGRLITYGTVSSKTELNKVERIQQYFSKISYEIYLIQYPVIYIFQIFIFKEYFKTPLIILITILLAMLLHFAFKKEDRKNIYIYQLLVLILFAVAASYGLYSYIMAEDHTQEMKLLEEQLNENEKTIKNKQEEYAERLKQEEEQLNASLQEIEQNEAGLAEYIHQLPVIGVGDSVMLGAFSCLYEQFPNGYFDAKVSRTDYEANRILQSIKDQGFLGNPIIINLGTNGQCGASCQYTILRTIENRKLFWINVVNDWSVHVNAGLNQLAKDNDNVSIIDWAGISAGHNDYFVADGIHLTRTGCQEYAKSIYEAIYQSYKQEMENKKKQILTEHENSVNKKIAFYGNDLLIKAYDTIQQDFTDYELEFHAAQEQTIAEIIKDIKTASKSSSFPKHIVILLDSSMELTEKQYKTLEEINSNIYLITMKPINYNGSIQVIDFSKEIQKHDSYLMIDQIHLTEQGNQALSKEIISIIKK